MALAGQILTHCKCGTPRTMTTHFYSYGGKREKRQRSICKKCHDVSTRAWYAKNMAHVSERAGIRRRSSAKSMAASIFQTTRNRAKRRDIEFTITREMVRSWLEVGKCAVTGAAFDITACETRQNPNSPSIDRINPKYGYIIGNCRMVTWIYNRAKGDGTDEAVLEMARLLHALSLSSAA